MNYLSICQELEEVNNCIKIYKSKIEEKKSRAEKLEEYKKAMENGVKPVYVESQEFAKPVNPIFILLESKLYFEELKKILLSDYKSLAKNPVSLVQDNWHCFMLKSNSGYIRSDESKVIFHEDLSDDYYSELLLELNKLDDFNIERTAQSLSIIQNDQFPSRKYVEQFDYGVLKDIISFKVDKFEKVLQLLNFPKEIEVVLGRVQYVLNEDTKEYELQFLNLKDELQVKGDLFENNNIKNNGQIKFILKVTEENDLFTNSWVDESFEYLARAANKKDTGRDLILTIRKGLGKLEYKIKKLTYEYEGQGKNIKVKELELSENSDNEAELKVIFERSFSILEKIYNYSKAQVNHTLKSYKDKRAELKRFNQQELENLIKNNTKEKEDFN